MAPGTEAREGAEVTCVAPGVATLGAPHGESGRFPDHIGGGDQGRQLAASEDGYREAVWFTEKGCEGCGPDSATADGLFAPERHLFSAIISYVRRIAF